MKAFLKSIFILITAGAYIFALLMGLFYFIGGLTYTYYSEDTFIDAIIFLGVAVLILTIFIALAIISFRFERGSSPRVFGNVGLIVLFLSFSISGFYGFVYNGVVGPNGSSYTDDISNYGKYDTTVIVDGHFPKEITDDMTVNNFYYYYKNADRYHVDLYLEVKFENEEIMSQYIEKAKESFGENGTISYTNPYNSKYTDIVKNGANKTLSVRKNGERITTKIINKVKFSEYTYKCTEMFYICVSYSYEDLTVIYNYTDIGTDIFVGNNPDKGEYYPKLLEYFGVEWNPENDFTYLYEE